MPQSYNPFPPAGSEDATGLALPELCASVWNLWFKCQDGKCLSTGEPLPYWVEMPDEYRYGWQRGITSTLPILEAADGNPETSSWMALGRQLYTNVQAAVADGAAYRLWEELESAEKLLWLALVRHTANLMVYDVSDESVEDFEDRMKLWYQGKRQQ